ncbi:MAG: sulfatase-like hydrolase/transferase, partial [Planctomycetia bacterium]|nr:sulfatase-like hydrolase/transferase [Planctomycetia bacterium]
GDVPFGWQATSNDDAEEPDGITARRVVKLLEQHKDGPFFIAAGFHKPHVPHTAPKKYFDMYDVAKMPLPKEPEGHAKYIPEIAQNGKYYPELKPEQERAIIQHYHAATTFMDAQVGLLLDALDRLKLWDNTVVVFLGDHGWHLGEHDGFWAKMSLMEESARAPLIIYAPGKKSNADSPRLAEFVDVFPTLTDLCGLPLANGLEGISLAPLLDDPNRPRKKAVFTVVSRRGGLGRSVRTETHELLVWPDGSEQLYDHTRDPHEYENLALDTRVKETADSLRKLLKDGWQAAVPR